MRTAPPHAPFDGRRPGLGPVQDQRTRGRRLGNTHHAVSAGSAYAQYWSVKSCSSGKLHVLCCATVSACTNGKRSCDNLSRLWGLRFEAGRTLRDRPDFSYGAQRTIIANDAFRAASITELPHTSHLCRSPAELWPGVSAPAGYVFSLECTPCWHVAAAFCRSVCERQAVHRC
jgi:hypothetical protein